MSSERAWEATVSRLSALTHNEPLSLWQLTFTSTLLPLLKPDDVEPASWVCEQKHLDLEEHLYFFINPSVIFLYFFFYHWNIFLLWQQVTERALQADLIISISGQEFVGLLYGIKGKLLYCTNQRKLSGKPNNFLMMDWNHIHREQRGLWW